MLARSILSFIKTHRLFTPLDRVLVGVSGGADSLGLLYLLNDIRIKLGIQIAVAHLNHGLRGKASDLDEKFVDKTCRCLEVDFISRKIYTKRRKSYRPTEAALRSARLSFLFDAAKKFNCNKIALGHTIDDQAETVLMRLIRGSGLYGLISMTPKRQIDSHTFVRPLLGTVRSDILRYLKKKNITPRIDASNARPIFLRNKIRHSLLKELSSLNPNIKQTLARFAEQAAVDYDFLFRQAIPFISSKQTPSMAIKLDPFLKLHESLQRMIIRLSLEKISGSLRTITYSHWRQINELVRNRPQGSVVSLTKGIKVKKGRRDFVIFTKH